MLIVTDADAIEKALVQKLDDVAYDNDLYRWKKRPNKVINQERELEDMEAFHKEKNVEQTIIETEVPLYLPGRLEDDYAETFVGSAIVVASTEGVSIALNVFDEYAGSFVKDLIEGERLVGISVTYREVGPVIEGVDPSTSSED